MILSQIIVDDFFDKPDAIRRTLLETGFTSREPDARYSGINTERPMLLKDSDRMFSQLAHEPILGDARSGHGKWRLSLAGGERTGDIHIDPGTWSGIVYLTPDDYVPPDSGTEFFRHIGTNSITAPLDAADAQNRFGMESREAVLKETIYKEGTDRTKWEMIQLIPMRYNRLVMFRPWAWHAASADFGTAPDNGRLIQVLFFKPNPGQNR